VPSLRIGSFLRCVILTLAWTIFFLLCACSARHEPALAITHVTIIDMTDAAPLADQTVVIEKQRIAAIGPSSSVAIPRGAQIVDARGKFVILQVKTWFDERTISAHRGNGLLTPNPRKVVLVDDTGRSFEPSAEGQAAFARLGNVSTPLSVALRPGESYTTDFVFDVPQEAQNVLLLITEDDRETRLVIGHENSLWHKKIYSGLDSIPPLSKAAH